MATNLNPNIEQVITAASTIAKQRGEIVAEMRQALERGDDRKALKLARRYCGLTDEKTGNRVN